jgi:chromosome segregation protein
LFLKRLELFGFKSFAERTVLNFEPGITAIVGPNGCGKSNVVDAIKWVLGEQSAKELRGARMEEVIFNGTQTHPPLNLAEVSITFSNDDRALAIDYAEVTVTRRLYRSGESEYLLNKTPVRLRDILELLMGTGIGTSAYSLFEQGKVESIISSSPEDRRYIFEEAAGITKYKSKKKEALRRLEDTENNLNRLGDVMQEVKRQINSIERQAQKAKRYQETLEHLKSLELRVARDDVFLKEAQKRTIDGDIAALQEKVKALQDSRAALEAQSNAVRETIRGFVEEYTQLTQQFSALHTKIENNNHKIASNEARIKELDDEKTQIRHRASLAQEKIDSLAAQAARQKEELEGFDATFSSKNDAITNYNGELETLAKEIKAKQGAIAAAKPKILEVSARETQLKNELAQLQGTLHNFEVRLKRLELEDQKTHNEIEAVSSNLHTQELTVSSKRQQAHELFTRQEELTRDLEARKAETDRAFQELHTAQTAYHVLEDRKKFIQELRASSGKDPSGMQTLATALKERTLAVGGFAGFVKDFMTIKHGYEMAVYAALGVFYEACVIATQRDAQKVVDYARTHALEGVSIVVLESLPENASLPAQGLPGDCIPLRQCVDIHDTYARALGELLKGFFVTQTSPAHEILEACRKTCACIVDKNGWCYCENKIRKSSLKGLHVTGDIRAQEEDVRKESASLQEKISALSEVHATHARAVESLQDSLREVEATIKAHQEEGSDVRVNFEKNKDDLKRLQDELFVIASEVKETGQEKERVFAAHEKLRVEVASCEQEKRDIDTLIQNFQDEIQSSLQRKETITIAITQARADVDNIEHLKKMKADTIAMLEATLRHEEASTAMTEQDVKDTDQKQETLRREIAVFGEEIDSYKKELSGLQSAIDARKERQNEHNEKLESLESQERALNDEYTELESRIHHHEMEKTKIDFEITTIANRLQQVYALALSADEANAAGTMIPEEEKRALVEEIEKLRKKIDSLGQVNLVAIEEHKELQERHSFLERELNDLLKAKEDLHKVITQINKTTREMFKTTFEEVQKNFKEFFKLLFGGGNATLILQDEHNVLESGIDIIAQPPGKKLQSIQLLSGGEKALTSVALLFAIFKVKPSPFCLLDEIDAPLDESNVVRFGRVVSGFVDHTQFVVITHNKKTINLANVMYGVTMPESKISKIVSVKFAEPATQKV